MGVTAHKQIHFKCILSRREEITWANSIFSLSERENFQKNLKEKTTFFLPPTVLLSFTKSTVKRINYCNNSKRFTLSPPPPLKTQNVSVFLFAFLVQAEILMQSLFSEKGNALISVCIFILLSSLTKQIKRHVHTKAA